MTESIQERIVWGSVLGLVALVPVATANLTVLGIGRASLLYDRFQLPKLAILITFLSIAVLAWVWAPSQQRVFRYHPVFLGVAGVVGWYAVTSLVGVHPVTSLVGAYSRFEGTASMLLYAFLVVLVVQVVDSAARLRTLLRVAVASGGVVAGYGVMQWLGWDPVDWGVFASFEQGRVFSTYGNPDLLAGYLIFPMLIAAALVVAESSRAWRAVGLVTLLVSIVALLATFVRGGWVGALMGGVLLIVGVTRLVRRLRKRDVLIVVAVVMVVAAVIAGSFVIESPLGSIPDRAISIVDFKSSGSAVQRLDLWGILATASLERPLTGYGPDTVRFVFPRYRTAEWVSIWGNSQAADAAHNHPLQLAVTVGIPGLLLVAGTWLWALAIGARGAFTAGGGLSRVPVAGLTAALAGVMTYLLLGIAVTGIMAFVWLCVGLLVAPSARPIRIVGGWKWWAVRALGTLTVVGLMVFGGMLVSADHLLRDALIIAPPEQQTLLIGDAIDRNPLVSEYRVRFGLAYADRMIASSSDKGLAGRHFTAAREALRSTIDWNPWEYDAYRSLVYVSNMASAVGLDVDADEVVRAGETALAVSPTDAYVMYQMGSALRREQRLDEAGRWLQRAVELDPGYNAARLLYAEVLGLQGRPEQARDQLNAVLAKRPDDPRAREMLESLVTAAR